MRGLKVVWITIGLTCLGSAVCAQDMRPRLGETDAEYRARIGGAASSRTPAKTTLLPKVGETKAEYEARLQGRPMIQSAPSVVEIHADRSGHFVTEATVRGQTVAMLVDTGASAVALPYEVAQRLGFRLNDADFRATTATANGTAKVAPVTLDEVRIGDVVVQNVSAFVGKPGALNGTALLGMSFLSKLQKYEMANGVLKLFR